MYNCRIIAFRTWARTRKQNWRRRRNTKTRLSPFTRVCSKLGSCYSGKLFHLAHYINSQNSIQCFHIFHMSQDQGPRILWFFLKVPWHMVPPCSSLGHWRQSARLWGRGRDHGSFPATVQLPNQVEFYRVFVLLHLHICIYIYRYLYLFIYLFIYIHIL